MSDAARQIVGRLRSLGAQDREWVLCQLSMEERQQVLAVLTANDPGMETSAVPGDARRSAALPVASGRPVAAAPELTALENADGSELAALLAGQTDWTVVTLLAAKDWSWTEDFLGKLPPPKLRTLRELSSRLGDTVRPRVRDAVVRLVANQLHADYKLDDKRSIFDVVLERAERDARISRSDNEAST